MTPNLLSYIRILIGIAIPVLLFWPGEVEAKVSFWTLRTAIVFFIFGALTDFWDGWIARRRGLESPFGRILDPLADKIFILGTMTSFAFQNVYSYWYLVPIYLREASVTFCRIAWLRLGHAIGAEKAGKLKLCSQIASISFSFLFLLSPTQTNNRVNLFFLWVAVLMTLYSGFSFFKNNRQLLQDKNFLRMVPALGVGYLPIMPGTFGSLLGILLVVLIAHDPFLHLVIFSAFILLAYGVISKIDLTGNEDPFEFVIDEVAGILLAFVGIPLSWLSLTIGFLLFRFFDVAKIFPLNRLERLKGVNGIMMDDLGAGIYTWVILKILFR